MNYFAYGVDLITSADEHLKAITYYASETAIVDGVCPYTWYKQLVLNGAVEHGLPTDYVAFSIECVAATNDPDPSRDMKNRFD